MKINKSFVVKALFMASVMFVHFDPTRQKLTIVLVFMPLFLMVYSRMTIKNMLPVVLIILTIIFPLYNFVTFNGFVFSNFEYIKSYVLYTTSGFVHIAVIYFSLNREQFDFRKLTLPALTLILILAALQFFDYLVFKRTIFYNIFGRFQYNNIGNVEDLTSGVLPRAQSFYLEPSYLAFATISLVAVNLLYKFKEVKTLLIGSAIIILSGSRGGVIGIFLFILWYLMYRFRNVKLHLKFIYFGSILFVISAFIIFSSIPTLLSAESLATENTSQYLRLYSGYQLSGFVLNNFYFGIPLGSIEFAFAKFLNINNTAYSFFFLNVLYHGWLSILLLLFIGFSIYIGRNTVKKKLLLMGYLMLYFNMTGSVLAPDTFFWFFCVYYVYRVCRETEVPSIR